MKKVYISGLGQVPVSENWDKSLKELAGDAALLAMQDADIGYPDAESHAEKHRELTEKAIQIKGDCLAGKVNMVSLISFIIDDVIIFHLLEEDTKFFPYINKLS